MTTATIRGRGKVRAFAAAAGSGAAGATVFAASAGAPGQVLGGRAAGEPRAEQFQRIDRGGVESVRIGFDWGALQSQKGGRSTGVEPTRRSNARPRPASTCCPPSAAPRTGRCRSAKVPHGHGARPPLTCRPAAPASRAGRSCCGRRSARYGRGGEFWATHPDVPTRPIRFWQIWNEPNFRYFVAKPNPKEYGKLVKRSYSVIHDVDPGAKLVLAGLFSQPNGSSTWRGRARRRCSRPPRARLLRQLLPRTDVQADAGDQVEDRRRRAPPLRVQLAQADRDDRRSPPGPEQEPRPERGTLADRARLELRPRQRFSKGPAGQARELRNAFKLLLKKRNKWRIQRLYWFSVDDQEGACNFCDGSGLFGEGFKPKKSWNEYVKFAGGKR